VQLAGRLAKQIASSKIGQKILGNEGKELLVQNIPGAITGGLFTLAAGGSIPEAVGTAALDMGLSLGGARLAGKMGAPGTRQTVLRENVKDGVKTIDRVKEFKPSGMQQVAMGVGTVAAPVLMASFAPATQLAMQDPALLQQLTAEPTVMDQTASLQQQLMQREMVNKLQAQSLSPGTMFQMQGIEATLGRGMAADPRLDPYGLSRGMQG
jgi:hypothetical protein